MNQTPSQITLDAWLYIYESGHSVWHHLLYLPFCCQAACGSPLGRRQTPHRCIHKVQGLPYLAQMFDSHSVCLCNLVSRLSRLHDIQFSRYQDKYTPYLGDYSHQSRPMGQCLSRPSARECWSCYKGNTGVFLACLSTFSVMHCLPKWDPVLVSYTTYTTY